MLYEQIPVVISASFKHGIIMASTKERVESDGSSESEYSDDENSSNDEGEASASGEDVNDEEVSFNTKWVIRLQW